MIFSFLSLVPRSAAWAATALLGLAAALPAMAERVSASPPTVQTNAHAPALEREESSDLSAREAMRLTLKHNPELSSYAQEMGALEGAEIQSGLLRNPELALDTEDIGGEPNGAAQRSTTIRLSQLIELGGKRSARMAAAALARNAAYQDYEAKRLELTARAANAFTNVVAGQDRTVLAEESVQLAQSVASAVAKRVQAGKVPPIEETKAGLVLSSARIELQQAQRELADARKQLTLLWGNPAPRFARAQGDLASFVALPSFDTLAQRASVNPVALRDRRRVEQRKAVLDFEKARRIPDLTLSAGVRRYSQFGDNTALLSLSVPLPLFDRNQGNLREAYRRVDKAVDEHAATNLALQSELARTYEALLASGYEIKILRDEVLPAARSAFDVSNRGYELGKFGFLEVLDAQRTLFQNRILYLKALVNYQQLVNEIERLVAGPIETGSNAPAKPDGNKQ
ncbi:MAG: TolC family protein [Burkholderiales bacterium]